MGCDIHLYVEKRESGRWASADTWYDDDDSPGRKTVYKWGPGLQRLAGPLYSDRNYDLFAMLANVRNGSGFAGCDAGDGFVPIAMPRGVPADASAEYRAEVDKFGNDGHSHSYHTVAELMAYDWTQKTTKLGWVTPREFARFHLKGKPEMWASAVGGGGVNHVTNEEMLKLIMARATGDKFTWSDFHRMAPEEPFSKVYTQVSWQVHYYEQACGFLSRVMPHLWRLGRPENVRIVFFFDN